MLGADGEKYIAHAVAGAQRMNELINDVLTYSVASSQAIEGEPSDTHKIVKQVFGRSDPQIRAAGAEINCSELPMVSGNPTQIRQVFSDLISNAIKYHRFGVSPKINIAASLSRGMWTFSVDDNGIGIETEYFDRIFGLFERLHSRVSYSGTGLGLAIVKKVISRHGGRIWLTSDVGKGTTFYFTLPTVEAESKKSAIEFESILTKKK